MKVVYTTKESLTSGVKAFYHGRLMRVTKKKKSGGGGWLLFWLAFLIGITILFVLNLERMKETLNQTRVLERFFPGSGTGDDPAADLERHIQELASAAAGEANAESEAASPAGLVSRNGEAETEPASPALDVPVPLDETAAEIAAQKERDAAQPPQTTAAAHGTPGSGTAAKTVERLVYLMKVDSAGTILWTSVKRTLPAGDSPLLDALNVLIKGPSAAEEKQGLISLIPKNTKIRNATVRGNTAYINFSEDFLFNTYGVEGYASQRKQIVLTATEFSNVQDVQILIEGKRVDYLGEGVWIGSPVGRDML
jgi:spore germination protein GerM